MIIHLAWLKQTPKKDCKRSTKREETSCANSEVNTVDATTEVGRTLRRSALGSNRKMNITSSSAPHQYPAVSGDTVDGNN